jgi:hypothetical protein
MPQVFVAQERLSEQLQVLVELQQLALMREQLLVRSLVPQLQVSS